MALLLLLVVSLPGSHAAMLPEDPKPRPVPVPTRLTFESYNLDTRLRWQYPHVNHTPVFFTVMVKTYESGRWANACNTSLLYCNISSQIKSPSESVWARVKARIGQNESAYAESREFILCRDGKIGPPKLHIAKEEDRVIVDVRHPFETVNVTDLEVCLTYSYKLDINIDGNKSSQVVCDLMKEEEEYYYEDDAASCQYSIPVRAQDSNYCVSAQGVSNFWDRPTEQSQYVCITVRKDDQPRSSKVLIPAVVAAVVVLLCAAVFVYCYMKEINPFKRKSIVLPASLVSVVKTAHSGLKPESKYISPITYKPVVLEHEGVSGELLAQATISQMRPEDSADRAEPRDLSSGTEVSSSTDDSAAALERPPVLVEDHSPFSSSSESDPSSSPVKSYPSRHGSDSGLVESGGVSDSEFPAHPKTEVKILIQEPIMPRNTPTSFGYDRPHVLVDLLVDDGGKESLIGYRPPPESKEVS